MTVPHNSIILFYNDFLEIKSFTNYVSLTESCDLQLVKSGNILFTLGWVPNQLEFFSFFVSDGQL